MPYDFKDITSANAYAEAESIGCTVRKPAVDELFIDINDAYGSTWFHLNIGKVAEQIGVVTTEWLPSPSGQSDHSHVVVKLGREVTQMERILLQSVLGSDRKREALSWVRLVNNDPDPTLFYEKKPLQLTEGAPLNLDILSADDYPF